MFAKVVIVLFVLLSGTFADAWKPTFRKGSLAKFAASSLLGFGLVGADLSLPTSMSPAFAASKSDLGANDGSNAKIRTGAASTAELGIYKGITRGVNLDKADFAGKQSIIEPHDMLRLFS
jgi:hypothetical protein